jgi:hypothetical protein
MANADDYAQWIVANQSKKGTPEFNTVAQAYKEAKTEESGNINYPQINAQQTKDVALRKRLQGENWLQRNLEGAMTGPSNLIEGVKQLAHEITTPYQFKNPQTGEISPIPYTGSQPLPRKEYDTSKIRQNRVIASEAPVGAIAGGIATALPLAFLPGGTSALGGIGYGAAYGALQPTIGNESRTENIAMGGLSGGIVPATIGTAKTVKSIIEPLTESGKQNIVGRTLQSVSGKEAPAVAQRLKMAQELIAGSKPTAAEVAESGGISALQRAAKSAFPSDYTTRELEQKAARIGAIESIAKDSAALEASKKARETITEPMYKAFSETHIIGGNELNDLLARMNSSGALQEAQKIAKIRGTKFDIPVIEPPQYGQISEHEIPSLIKTVEAMPKKVGLEKEPMGITGYLKKTGGINTEHILDVTGEKVPRKSGATVGLFTKKGRGLDDAVQIAVEGGYLPPTALNEVDGGVETLTNLIHNEINGSKAHPLNYNAFEQSQLKQYNQTPQQFGELIGKVGVGELPKPAETVVGRRIKGEDLLNLKKGIDEQIKNAVPGSPLQAELMGLKKDYMGWLDNQSAGFLEANNKFAEMSKPINQMKVGQNLLSKIEPAISNFGALGQETAAKYAKALTDSLQTVKQATGFQQPIEKLMTPQQMETLTNVGRDLARKSNADVLGKGVGSNTFQNLAMNSLINQSATPKLTNATIKTIDALLSHAPLGFNLLSPSNLMKGENQALQQKLAEALLNPQEAARLMDLANKLPSEKGQMLKKLIQGGMLSVPAQKQGEQ